jgi:hypothetical protein
VCDPDDAGSSQRKGEFVMVDVILIIALLAFALLVVAIVLKGVRGKL